MGEFYQVPHHWESATANRRFPFQLRSMQDAYTTADLYPVWSEAVAKGRKNLTETMKKLQAGPPGGRLPQAVPA